MDPISLTLHRIPGDYAVAKVAQWPDWLPADGFVSVTRTAYEISVVCETHAVPDGVLVEFGWALLEFQGPFAFALTGILDSAAGPLARAEIGIFALSTYDTDY
jgi:hypothetical protein